MLKGRDIMPLLKEKGYEKGTAQALIMICEFQGELSQRISELAQMIDQLTDLTTQVADMSAISMKAVDRVRGMDELDGEELAPQTRDGS